MVPLRSRPAAALRCVELLRFISLLSGTDVLRCGVCDVAVYCGVALQLAAAAAAAAYILIMHLLAAAECCGLAVQRHAAAAAFSWCVAPPQHCAAMLRCVAALRRCAALRCDTRQWGGAADSRVLCRRVTLLHGAIASQLVLRCALCCGVGLRFPAAVLRRAGFTT